MLLRRRSLEVESEIVFNTNFLKIQMRLAEFSINQIYFIDKFLYVNLNDCSM